MCFDKPRPLPTHLLLLPEPPVYRRPTPLWQQALVLLLISLALAGLGAVR
ncbi:MAG: hypothetical protein NVV73_16290 [Cellvibrionaceae bacterium]|nr:hypothetical protein [Cellvibrionaceae bacterium]